MARRPRRRWSEAGPGPGGSSQMFRGNYDMSTESQGYVFSKKCLGEAVF